MKTYEQSKINRIKRGANRATYNVEKINTILDAGFIGYVGYVFDGKAITIPMAYGRMNNKIILHGSNANRMLTTLLKEGTMSMTVMHLDALVLARSGFHHSVNYRSATLFGSVKKIEEKEAKNAALFCFMEHMMKGRWDGIREMNQQEFDRTLTLEMTIETASAKIRDVGVGDEPEDYNLDVWAGLVPIKQVAEYPIPDEGKPRQMEIPKHVLDYYEANK
ncbi:pyridoxamine 5'-phosphate oxidase family protein [Polaribacter aquimarinus]|uniref:Pyridoxamine 5'-phosphate oxidase family protein n=1 Tax=Polaribacter aquimarinus TaxID=2100726 RepID=A0A2U2JA57_9FLAO|nr:pyridoxamine 5'-phosphate oxidase family protein [Polaribacter aquimarinus]PWG05204.1 pyridoxamine 5'-phosphate oxidase family protein [Polaribacter aquimarinus]